MELVARCFPPGPDRAHFRSLCRLTRGLTNTCVTVAEVENWEQAEQLGTRFPHLPQLEVRNGWEGDRQHARNFLRNSATQLTKLITLEMGDGTLNLPTIRLLCSNLTRLQRLQLFGRCKGGEVTEVFKAIAELQNMEDLALQVTCFSCDWQIR